VSSQERARRCACYTHNGAGAWLRLPVCGCGCEFAGRCQVLCMMYISAEGASRRPEGVSIAASVSWC
jgi:hypothetical protein